MAAGGARAGDAKYRTGTTARLVGMSPALLRAWEARYSLVEPARGSGGQRLYSDNEVAVLAAYHALVERGHSIGELASWPRDHVLAAASPSEAKTSAPDLGAPRTSHRAVLVLDADGRIELAGPETEALLGWPPSALFGQPIWGFFLAVPPGFEELLVRAPTSVGSAFTPSTFLAWLATRKGPRACRIETGQPRRTTEGTRLTFVLTELAQDTALVTPFGAIDSLLVQSLGPTACVHACVEMGVEQLGAALARTWRYEESSGSLVLVASAGISKAIDKSSRARIRLANYPFKVGAVARSGIPYLHNGLDGDRDFDAQWLKREGLRSAAVLPILHDGHLVGVMAHFFRRDLTNRDIACLQGLSALAGQALQGPPSAK